MDGTWTTHFDGTIEQRPVVIQTYSEGGYLVKTTQGEDYDGEVFGDESNTVIVPPSPKGTPIDIDEETVDMVRHQLAVEGFSDEAIALIASYFPV